MGKYCTNYATEGEALIYYSHMICTMLENYSHPFFLTDDLSALKEFENNKFDRPSKALHHPSSDNQVMLQWIPAHCRIHVNGNADRLAKLATAKEQTEGQMGVLIHYVNPVRSSCGNQLINIVWLIQL